MYSGFTHWKWWFFHSFLYVLPGRVSIQDSPRLREKIGVGRLAGSRLNIELIKSCRCGNHTMFDGPIPYPIKNGDDWGMGWCKWHCFNHMSRSAMISQMISQMISPHVSSCFIMFHHLSSCLHHVSGWSTWIHGSQKCHQGEAFRLSGGTLASSVKTRRTALFPSHSPACHCPNQTISPGLNQCHPVPTSDFKLGLHHYFMEKITVVHMSHHFSHELCERLPPPLPTVVRFLRQGEALVSRKRLADKPSVGAWADCCWWGNHAEIPWSKHTLLLPGTQNISNFPCKNNKLLPKMG